MFRGKKAFLYVGGPFLILHLIFSVLFYTVLFKILDTDLRCAYIVIYMLSVFQTWSLSFSISECLCEAEDDTKLKGIRYSGDSLWILVVVLLNIIFYLIYEMYASRNHTNVVMVEEQFKCLIVSVDWIICGVCNKAYRRSQGKEETAG